MEEPNLETLIRDLYNHARQNLSEDLVAALLETAKQLPSTNERLLAVRLSGLVTLELLKNPKTPAPELVNLASFIQKEEARYKGAAASSIMIGELFKESGTIVRWLKKSNGFCRCFLHGCDSLGKIELHKKYLERLSHAYSL